MVVVFMDLPKRLRLEGVSSVRVLKPAPDDLLGRWELVAIFVFFFNRRLVSHGRVAMFPVR